MRATTIAAGRDKSLYQRYYRLAFEHGYDAAVGNPPANSGYNGGYNNNNGGYNNGGYNNGGNNNNAGRHWGRDWNQYGNYGGNANFRQTAERRL